MTQPQTGPGDTREVVEELRAARQALLELAREVPESRIYRHTARQGWTLKHELAALAAADAELLHVIDELRRRPAMPPDGLELRRPYAEAIHAMKELRLSALLDRLDEGGANVEAALREHGAVLARPLPAPDRGTASMAGFVHAYLERARGAVEAFRQT